MVAICEEISLPPITITDIKNYLNAPNSNINSSWNLNGEEIPYTPLVCACLNNDEEVVDYLLSKGANVSIGTDYHEHSCAHIAVNNKNLNILRKLIKCGANVEDRTSWKNVTLLHAAIYKKNYEIVKYLIELGANVNAVRHDHLYGITPLMTAVSLRSIDIVRLLVENGADVNAVDYFFGNALARSISWYHEEIMKVLISHGAYVSCKPDSKESQKMIHHLVKRSFSEPLDFLLHLNNELDVNALTPNKCSGLHIAPRCAMAKAEFFDHILEIGIDINIMNSSGRLAIEVAHATSIALMYPKFIRHIIKLIVANCFVCEKNIEIVNEEMTEKSFFHDCEIELCRMKTVKILGSNISYYDVFHTSEIKLAINLECSNIHEIRKPDLLKLFPLYGGIVYYRLLRIRHKIKLLKNVKAVYHKL